MKLNLNTIANGNANKVFERYLKFALENIADARTKATAPRAVQLTFSIAPQEDRQQFMVTVSGAVKVAGLSDKSVQGQGFITEDGNGNLVATLEDPRQKNLGLELVEKQKEA